jgi:peptidoglycan/xylan/chitin deacetylase (PgdA/CDA1 family)
MTRGKTILFCTSWDDGYRQDAKIAGLLDRFNLKGTFFVTVNYGIKGLTRTEIRNLATNHEIGSHTLNHPDLAKIPKDIAAYEITQSKNSLEAMVDREIESFCYPFGRYNSSVVEIVKKAGYKFARTTGRLNMNLIENRYLIAPTFAVVPRLISIQTMKAFLQSPLRALLYVAKPEFEIISRVNKKGIFFHLWGHSWDIERCDYWGRLASFFSYVSENYKIRPVTFSELVKKYTEDSY